ncbi:hypothetical protein HOLleu_16173 [Holothuria leucospilota]|uniref:TIR domain-containing protein n=1 Tax=Holothuria leucospilota TaxID=206669 RepID=A0A9Q1C4S3_HOLLE|nr:hypothetical protein HOLleu_16173 [Holothuria leucospilota]
MEVRYTRANSNQNDEEEDATLFVANEQLLYTDTGSLKDWKPEADQGRGIMTTVGSDSEGDTRSNDEASQHLNQSSGIAAPLEGEEKCHAFFCSAGEDDEWTHNVISRLESPAYGFKCANMVHELEPGAAKMDKVVNALSTAKKIVLVLSPDFMHTPWCMYENLKTLKPYLTDRTKVLVVTLTEVDLPEFLYDFPTIDARSNTFWQTFVGSLQIGFSSVDGSPRSSRSKEALVNGLELGQSSSTSHCVCKARFDTVYCPAGLARKGVVIPQHDFTNAISTILESSKMRWYSVWYNWYLHLIISIFITILITCGVVINLAKPGKEGKKGIGLGWSFAISWLLSTVACLMVHLIAYYERRRLNTMSESFLARANMIFSSHHVLVGMTDKFRGVWFRAVLHFIYYDLELCKNHMKEFLRQHRNTGGSKASSFNINMPTESEDSSRLTLDNRLRILSPETLIADTDPSSLDEEAELFLLQASPAYIKALIKNRLPWKNVMQRHCKRAVCLCQYVQWRVFHEPI